MDSLRLLATVAHLQAESGASDLETVTPNRQKTSQQEANGFSKLQSAYASGWDDFRKSIDDDQSLVQFEIQTLTSQKQNVEANKGSLSFWGTIIGGPVIGTLIGSAIGGWSGGDEASA